MKNRNWDIFIKMFLALRISVFWLWRCSGAAYIAAKAGSSENKEHQPTLVLWILGIYVAIFGLASQRYENYLDRFENKLNIYVAQLGTGVKNEIFPFLVGLQRFELPLEPGFFNPIITLKSIIIRPVPINLEPSHTQKITDIANVIIRFKYDLSGAVLIGVNLSDGDLNYGNIVLTNFESAILKGIKISGANAKGASFEGANLRDATLTVTEFSDANFKNSNLKGSDLRLSKFVRANFEGANLDNVDLGGADLRKSENLKCSQLMKSYEWRSAKRDIGLACGETIPSTLFEP